jgi:hypothetical protein
MTKSEKIKMVQAQQNSGLSARAFCAKHSIKLGTFQQWKYRWRLHIPPAFVEIIAGPPTTALPVVSVLKGSYRVEVPAGFDREHLTAVLDAIPC